MSTWLVPTNELTTAQNKAVEMDVSGHKAIIGAPGSGKTLVLAHRANFLRQKYDIANSSLHIFVYTNVLKNYIRAGLDLLDIPPECVTTFDSWCTDYYKKNINKSLPKKDKYIDYDLIRKKVYNTLQSGSLKTKFYVGLVDEGQDLDENAIAILSQIAHHVTICMDHNQQLYDSRPPESRILSLLGLRKKNMALLGAYRCSPYIVHMASRFIKDEFDQETFINQSQTEIQGRLTPLFYMAQDFDDETERLIQIIRDRQMRDKRIGILLPFNKHVYAMAKDLQDAGINVEVQNKNPNTNNRLDFKTNNPKLMTYYSAKGLTFDSVLLPRLSRSFFNTRWWTTERIQRLLFVGITRAKDWVYLSALEDNPISELSILDTSIEEGHLFVQDQHDLQPETNEHSLVNEDFDEEDDYPF